LPLLLAAAADHLNVFLIAIGLGFLVGVYGHIIHSRTLILTGIAVIAVISLYFVASGEIQTFPS
jgi:predicted ABC-type exoprotein transport system permease subunit